MFGFLALAAALSLALDGTRENALVPGGKGAPHEEASAIHMVGSEVARHHRFAQASPAMSGEGIMHG